MTLPTAERVRALLYYDPDTGAFTRKIRTAQRHQVGDRADCLGYANLAGYRLVAIDSQKLLAHRLAWLYVHGAWPAEFIDHMNGDKGDNRIANLREADNQLNKENTHRAQRNNRAGVLGVHRHQNSWRARIQHNGKTINIGCYATLEEAHAAYVERKRELHKGCTI